MTLASLAVAWRSYSNLSMDLHVKESFAHFSFSASITPDAVQDQGTLIPCTDYHTFPWVLGFLGEHHFSWTVMPHQGHLLNSDVPIAGYLYISPLSLLPSSFNWSVDYSPMPSRWYTRYSFITSFSVRRGRCPQCLETVKRGDDLFEEAVDPSIVYEAYGGYAQVRLLISHHLPVIKAITIPTSWRMKTRSFMFYALRIYLMVLAAPCR